MKVKITDKNAVLKTAKTFMEEDISIEIDESLLGGSGGVNIEEIFATPKTFTLNCSIAISFGSPESLYYSINGGNSVTVQASGSIALSGNILSCSYAMGAFNIVKGAIEISKYIEGYENATAPTFLIYEDGAEIEITTFGA